MQIAQGRNREVQKIRKYNRAAAVGKLMLKELNDWNEFLKADQDDLENLPRRFLKSAYNDVKKRLSTELDRFCKQNFLNMNVDILSNLYEEIKKYRGLEISLSDFEKKYAPIHPQILIGFPLHLTVSISLWGLQFKFPENELSKDIIEAMGLATNSQIELKKYEKLSHKELLQKREEITSFLRMKFFTIRMLILSCFNLLEAYLNGLAWDYIYKFGQEDLSNRQYKCLTDSTSVSIRDKLKKYPEIISKRTLWEENDGEIVGFIDIVKPYRDSLVHPSPFSAPEKFGGYDKLLLFYKIDFDTAFLTVDLLIKLINKIHFHINPDIKDIPKWIDSIIKKRNEISL